MPAFTHLLRVTSLGLLAALAGACASGTREFGASCSVDDDCASRDCVGGEAGGPFYSPFCSTDCSGKKTGDTCGDGRGRCLTDWCWQPCTTNDDCADFDDGRGVCGNTTSHGKAPPFSVCIAQGPPPI